MVHLKRRHKPSLDTCSGPHHVHAPMSHVRQSGCRDLASSLASVGDGYPPGPHKGENFARGHATVAPLKRSATGQANRDNGGKPIQRQKRPTSKLAVT
jgi:hypothetical protein